MATMSINVRPLHDRILVPAVCLKKKKRPADFSFPDNAKEKAPNKPLSLPLARAVSLMTVNLFPSKSKRATKFFLANTPGTELKFEGKEYLMIREEDVLGVLN